ncbi:MAG: phosphotransferase family protein, partial [Burkholderiales bacterium PBB5]
MDNFTGTRAVSASHAFDNEALGTWLTANMSGFAGPLSVEQFKGGQSNPTYKLVTPGRSYVMRSKPGPQAKLLPSAHAIEREYKVMNALALSGVPVARMHVLWDQALPASSNDERAAIYDEMNRVIATLHSVDVKAVGLADFGKPGNYFARQIGRWTKQYQASVLEPIPEMDQVIDWLPTHLPA